MSRVAFCVSLSPSHSESTLFVCLVFSNFTEEDRGMYRLYEMQAFLVELVSNFEFAITEDIKKLRREPCIVMVPVLEGNVEKGAQLPLKISLARRD